MKPLRRLLFYPVLLPGFAVTFFASCSGAPKPAVGQWPLKAPEGVRQAAYAAEPVRMGRIRVALNGDVWEGALLYHGAELDSLHTRHSNNPRLAQILEREGAACFALPLFDEGDKTPDLTELWVSSNFEEGGRIITEDVNFDGYKDLVLLDALESSLSQRSYHIWLYNPKQKSYYFWDLAGRTGGELMARNRRRRELLVGTADSETRAFRVAGDTTLQPVVASGHM